jgi:hypothetical protein
MIPIGVPHPHEDKNTQQEWGWEYTQVMVGNPRSNYLKVEIKFKLKTTDDSSFLGRMKLSIQASCQSQPGTKRH